MEERVKWGYFRFCYFLNNDISLFFIDISYIAMKNQNCLNIVKYLADKC